jgi:hypothetical protein
MGGKPRPDRLAPKLRLGQVDSDQKWQTLQSRCGSRAPTLKTTRVMEWSANVCCLTARAMFCLNPNSFALRIVDFFFSDDDLDVIYGC